MNDSMILVAVVVVLGVLTVVFRGFGSSADSSESGSSSTGSGDSDCGSDSGGGDCGGGD